jgi:hypothetical protein
LTLVWQSRSRTDEDLAVRVELVDADGVVHASTSGAPVNGVYPTDRWEIGEYVTDYRVLPVELEVPPGDYFPSVTIADSDGLHRAAWSSTAAVTVLPATTLSPGDTPLRPLRETWPGVLRLEGYDGPSSLRPGDHADFRLVWRVDDALTAAELTVVAGDGRGGRAAATVRRLQPGRLFATRHTLEVPADPGLDSWRPTVRVVSSDGVTLPHRAGLRGFVSALFSRTEGARGVGKNDDAYRLPAIEIRPAPDERVARARFADGLRLVEERLPTVVTAGQRIYIPLQWEAYAKPARRYTASVQLLHPVLGRLQGQDREILHATLPTNEWEQGRLIADVFPFDVPAGLESGGYTWLVTLYDHATKEPVPLVDADGIALSGRLLFPALVPADTSVPLASEMGVRLGDEFALREAAVSPVRHGAPISVTLRWEALRPPTRDYTLFVHVVQDGEIVTQRDAQPFDGAFPTSAWPQGQAIDTTVAVEVPPNLQQSKPYEIRVGLYDLATGLRLPVLGPGASTRLDYTVVPP